MNAVEGVGFVLILIACILANVVGIGGGPFFLPIGIILFSFDSHEAIPLSDSIIAGVLLFRYLISINERHFKKDKPLIDYELAALFSPSILMGSIFGVLMNRVLPSWIILIFVVILMFTNFVKSFTKGMKMGKQAKALRLKEQQEASGKVDVSIQKNAEMKEDRKESEMEDMDNDDNIASNHIDERIEEGNKVKNINARIKRISSPRKSSNKKDYQNKEPASPIMTEGFNPSTINLESDNNLASMMKVVNPSKEELRGINDGLGCSTVAPSEFKPNSFNSQTISERGGLVQVVKQEAMSINKNIEIDNNRDNSEEDERNQEEKDKKKAIEHYKARQIHYIKSLEAKKIPWNKIGIISIGIVFLTIFSLLKGSKNVKSIAGVPMCSAGFFVLTFAFVPVSLCILAYLVYSYSKLHDHKKDIGYEFDDEDLHWTVKYCVKIAVIGFFIGVAAGMLGIGAGIVTGPILLDLGIHPRVASYTSSFITLFAATATTIQYMIFGVLNYQYAGMAIIFGIVGAFIGIKCILNWVKRNRKEYVIVLTLAVVVLVACILIVYSGVNQTITKHRQGDNVWTVRSMC